MTPKTTMKKSGNRTTWITKDAEGKVIAFRTLEVPGTPRAVGRARGAAAKKPLGSATVIPNVNPLRTVIADDVSVYGGGAPRNTPTVAKSWNIAPGVGGIICDSLALAAGDYYVEITLSSSGVAAAGKHLQVEHRNAANSATLANGPLCPMGGVLHQQQNRWTIALNERIRVIQSASIAAAAGEHVAAEIRLYLLPPAL